MSGRDTGYHQLMAFLVALLVTSIVLGIVLAVRGSPSTAGQLLPHGAGGADERISARMADESPGDAAGYGEPTAFRRFGPPERPLAVIRYYPLGGLRIETRPSGGEANADFDIGGLLQVRQLTRQLDLPPRQQRALGDMERSFVGEAMLDLNHMATRIERAGDEWAYFHRRGPDEDAAMARGQFAAAVHEYARQSRRLSSKYLTNVRSLLDEQHAGQLDIIAAQHGYGLVELSTGAGNGTESQDDHR